MSLVETLPDDQYLASLKRRLVEVPWPVVRYMTRAAPKVSDDVVRETVTFDEPHQVPTYAQYLDGIIGIGIGTFGRILADVSRRHEVTVEEMMSASRRRHICAARQEVMWLARHTTKLSFPAIAERLGGRDHTTIVHGIRAHEKRMRHARPDASSSNCDRKTF